MTYYTIRNPFVFTCCISDNDLRCYCPEQEQSTENNSISICYCTYEFVRKIPTTTSYETLTFDILIQIHSGKLHTFLVIELMEIKKNK